MRSLSKTPSSLTPDDCWLAPGSKYTWLYSLFTPLSGISGQQSVHSRRLNIQVTTNRTRRPYAKAQFCAQRSRSALRYERER